MIESEAIADALIEAAARGVEVGVVADTDELGQHGFRRLIEAQSDGIDLVDGDAELGKPISIRTRLFERAMTTK